MSKEPNCRTLAFKKNAFRNMRSTPSIDFLFCCCAVFPNFLFYKEYNKKQRGKLCLGQFFLYFLKKAYLAFLLRFFLNSFIDPHWDYRTH